MMVTFISQCEKKALSKTRRILDTFADRIGDNAWQTMITQEGLLAVKKLLRRTASKNTAVSCHWIRSRSRVELVWVVGSKNKFDHEGKVPVNSTVKNQVYRDDLSDWKFLPVIRALACLAALLHDWGKACARFQEKLAQHYKGGFADRLRHEWISILLLKALIASSDDPTTDEGWLTILKNGELDECVLKSSLASVFEKPLANLPDVAKLVAWLIVTHHRLPLNKGNLYKNTPCTSLEGMFAVIDESWGYENKGIPNLDLSACLDFPQGLLKDSKKWIAQLKRWSGKLLDLQNIISRSIKDGSYRVLLHHARLSLMLGDHYFSSLDISKTPNWQKTNELIANTQKGGLPKQALDQHLVGVCENAKNIVGKLPIIEKNLEPSFNTAELKRKSPKFYEWQDIAAKKVRNWYESCDETKKGFFAVNMASTGCGKTFANAKVMMALSEDGDSLRYILALGLRTLTLQTGDEYRERIFVKSEGDDLAVLIGSKAIADLHYQSKQKLQQDQKDKKNQEEQGSESIESLLADADEVNYKGELPQEGLSTILRKKKDKQLLYAPVLACTIDHIIAATETTRGGRYILPALRLLSSDLVIDEVDDFTGSDLIAIGRLIHLAGMLGRKVMISSATIPPSMAEGYFNAYREGWSLYCKTRNASSEIGCAWIDEFTTRIESVSNTDKANDVYREYHDSYVNKRVAHLNKQLAKRKATIVECKSLMEVDSTVTILDKKKGWFNCLIKAAEKKHEQHHTIDEKTNLKVSFGVVRIANIQPCVQLTRFLLNYDDCPEDTEIRVMAYHSRQVLLLRHEQEKHLDSVLKRKEAQGKLPQFFDDKLIRKHLDNISANRSNVTNVLFILVATPVEEVGRDHDFDWAVIEPSSYRSIIQLAGRVRRHRHGEITTPNIAILQYNWRTVKKGDKERKPRFCFPGYESYGKLNNDKNRKYAAMKSHDLFKVVDVALIGLKLDSIPRIQEGGKTQMASLEHAVIRSQLAYYSGKGGPETLQGYIKHCWHLTALPQVLSRFRNSAKDIQLYRVANDDGDTWFTERDSKGKFPKVNSIEYSRQDDAYQISSVSLTDQESERLWMQRDYFELLKMQSELKETSLNEVAICYGEINLDFYDESSDKKYEYNDQLGLYERENSDA